MQVKNKKTLGIIVLFACIQNIRDFLQENCTVQCKYLYWIQYYIILGNSTIACGDFVTKEGKRCIWSITFNESFELVSRAFAARMIIHTDKEIFN